MPSDKWTWQDPIINWILSSLTESKFNIPLNTIFHRCYSYPVT